jgi:phenylalanyl-tRNA synthetase beta chain
MLKSVILNLIDLCKIEELNITENESPVFISSLKISSGKLTIGEIGIVNKSWLKNFDITDDVFFADLNYDSIIKAAGKKPVIFSEISKFPAVKRDLSMLIGAEVSYEQLQKIAFNTEKKLLRDIRLFDIYEGDKIENGKKSFALSFILQDDQQTLTDNQIVKVMDRLMNAFEKEAGAVIRKS